MAACPVLTLYHGTNGDNAASILNAGLQASTDGRLGTGVYFSDSKAVATSIAALKDWLLSSHVKCNLALLSTVTRLKITRVGMGHMTAQPRSTRLGRVLHIILPSTACLKRREYVWSTWKALSLGQQSIYSRRQPTT